MGILVNKEVSILNNKNQFYFQKTGWDFITLKDTYLFIHVLQEYNGMEVGIN